MMFVIHSKPKTDKRKVMMYVNENVGEFENKGWEFTVHNIKHEDNKKELLEKLPDVKTVPQIWIDDEHIGGYDDLMKWLKNRPGRWWHDHPDLSDT